MNKWIVDDAGDLINLAHIECIILVEIEDPESKPHPDVTHEVLATTHRQDSFRIASGTKKYCQEVLQGIAESVSAINHG